MADEANLDQPVDLSAEPGAPSQPDQASSEAPPFDLGDGLTMSRDEIMGYRDRATNADKAIASSTQRWEDAAEHRRHAEAALTQAQTLEQQFYSSPEIQDLMQAQRLIQSDPQAAARYQTLMANVPGNPMLDRAMQRIGALEHQAQYLTNRERQGEELRVQRAAEQEIGEFKKVHPEFEDDQRFNEFMQRFATETDTANLEAAYRHLYWDTAQNQARQQGRHQVIDTEHKKENARLMPPTTTTAPPWQPNTEGAGLMNQSYNAAMSDPEIDFSDVDFDI